MPRVRVLLRDSLSLPRKTQRDCSPLDTFSLRPIHQLKEAMEFKVRSGMREDSRSEEQSLMQILI